MITLKDIAKEAGLSAMAVSNILNGRNKETRLGDKRRAAKVRRIAQRLNYVPNASARAMRNRYTRQIGVLIINSPDSRFSFPDAFEEILGVNESLELAGHSLGLIRIDDIRKSELSQLRVFSERLYDGMITLGAMPADVRAKVKEAFRHAIWVEPDVLEPTGCIRRDESDAGRQAAQHAVRNGYRRLVWFGTNVPAGTFDFYNEHRFAGISQVANKHGLEVRKLELASWFDLARPLPPLPAVDRRTCIITRDAGFANRLAHAYAEVARVAGRHYGLISCENSFHFRFSWPQLCHVESDRFAMGAEAATMMLSALAEPGAQTASKEVRGRLVEGTTAPKVGTGDAG
jgi:DNA-binding LacI/PurR family transcriptional regulator